jgi:hypothetical protein
MATLIYLKVIGESHGGLPPARLASIAEAWPGADASEGKTREIFGCCLMSAYTPTARLTRLLAASPFKERSQLARADLGGRVPR